MNFRVLQYPIIPRASITILVTDTSSIAEAVLAAIKKLGFGGFRYAREETTGQYYKITWTKSTYKIIPVNSYQGHQIKHKTKNFKLPNPY